MAIVSVFLNKPVGSFSRVVSKFGGHESIPWHSRIGARNRFRRCPPRCLPTAGTCTYCRGIVTGPGSYKCFPTEISNSVVFGKNCTPWSLRVDGSLETRTFLRTLPLVSNCCHNSVIRPLPAVSFAGQPDSFDSHFQRRF